MQVRIFMTTFGPQSEQEIKFAAIARARDYYAKRMLIEQLSAAEKVAYNAQLQQRYGAKAPQFTPLANWTTNNNTTPMTENNTITNIPATTNDDPTNSPRRGNRPSSL